MSVALAEPESESAIATPPALPDRPVSFLDQVIDATAAARAGGLHLDRRLLHELQDAVAEWCPQDGLSLDGQLEVYDKYLRNRINASVNRVLEHPEVTAALEAVRGISYFHEEKMLPEDLEYYTLEVTPADVLSQYDIVGGDIVRMPLYKTLIAQHYGQFGGDGLQLVDCAFELQGSATDVLLLDILGRIGQAGHLQFLVNLGPGFCGFEAWSELHETKLSDLPNSTNPVLQQYLEFRRQEYSAYVTVTFPRLLTRAPHSAANPAPGLPDFVETRPDPITTPASTGLARLIGRAMATGWAGGIAGEDTGGSLTGLHVPPIDASDDDGCNVPTTSIITDDQEVDLMNVGFTVFVGKKNRPQATVFAAMTARSPDDGAEDPAQAAMHAQLPVVLVVSQFAKYLKKLLRKLIGLSMPPAQIQAILQKYCDQFVCEDPSKADEVLKAARPFQSIKVHLEKDATKPGFLSANIDVRPHYRVQAVDARIVVLPN